MNDLVVLLDGKANRTMWLYDVEGRMQVKTNQANAIVQTNGYNAKGELTARWTPAKGLTAYDRVGNVTLVNYPSGTTDITLQYNHLSRLTNMVDAAGTTKFTYTSAGDLLTEDGPFSNIAYTYDAARRLKTVSGTAGNFTNFYHSGLNSVTAPSKLIQQMRLPNSAFITNICDGLARMADTALRHSSGGSNINRHAYVYNNGHQRTKQTRIDGGYVDYLYDDVGQKRVNPQVVGR